MTEIPPCTIEHDSTEITGWELTSVVCEKTYTIKHVVPHNDLRAHLLDPTCWCHPVEDADEPDMWSHNSADGRERYENGDAAYN